MFRNAKAVIDRAIAACGIKPRCCAQFLGIDQCYWLQIFGAVAGLRNKLGPMAEFIPIASFANECLIG